METPRKIKNKLHLLELDEARDRAICGIPLSIDRATHYADEGAHDPTASYYFVLEKLFSHMKFSEDSWLLDVGCSAGRTLAYFVDAKLPGRATGIELDPDLAQRCRSWAQRFPNLEVLQGNALELPLSHYSHFYLFNPFDTRILTQFVGNIEAETTHPTTFCHMSDNGESYLFWGRPGWSLEFATEFVYCDSVPAYDCPQHCSIWSFDPALA